MKTLLATFAAALLLAAFNPARAAEQVTVTYTDGKSDSGELLSQDADKIVMRVSVGGNHVDMPIVWARIQKLSNGLTQDAAAKKWKADNQDKLCPDCNGDKKIVCKKCTGTCTFKLCDKGQVPCPGKCLKLSEGKWVKGKEDHLWRRFDYKGGYMEWSDRHLGEVIEFNAAGVPENKGPCPLCNGTQKAACKVCEGKGVTQCTLCKGAKEIPAPGPEKKCPDCNGAKKVTCPTCKGTGLKG